MEPLEEESKYEVREGFLATPSLEHPHLELAPVYDFEKIQEVAKEANPKGGKRNRTKLKITESVCEPYPDISMFDIKLNARGIFEDDLYLSRADLLKNVRRGNTYLRYKNTDGEEVTKIGRKGMIKFYDLTRDMLEEGSETRDSKGLGKNNRADEIKKGFSQFNFTLSGVYKSLQQGYRVEVIKTLKANGENAQVSWNSELGMWIFCSKNVAMLVKNKEEVAKYQEAENPTRYQFSTLIANAWFDKLEKIEEAGADIEKLKAEIDGRTLIGEYCGNPEHQHLIEYPEVRIIFYTIVDNESSHSCILPEESVRIFKEYGLETVTFESLGVFESYAPLKECLKEAYVKTGQAQIATDEEGSVIYLVRRRVEEGQEADRILNLAKLKTLEYRFYRKLREKVKGTSARLAKKGSGGKKEKNVWKCVVSKFKGECKELIKGIDKGDNLLTEEELNDYVTIADLAVTKLYDEPEQQTLIQENYLTFLKEIVEQHFGESTRLVSRIFDIQDEVEYTKPDIE